MLRRSLSGKKLSCKSLTLKHNGPAVELVGVAERLEAVTRKALMLRAGSRHTAERSEAWRGFCHPGTSFGSYTSVAVQISKRAGNESRYTKFYREQVRGRVII